MARPVETLRWAGDRLELIDQRLLPQRVEYVACDTAAEVAAAIRESDTAHLVFFEGVAEI